VPYYELADGHQHDFDGAGEGGRRVTRVCRVKEENLGQFLLAMLGDVTADIRSHSRRIHRTLPEFYTHVGGLAFGAERLWCSGAEFVQGLLPYQASGAAGSRGDFLRFREYIYRVHFAPRDYDLLEDNAVYLPGAGLGEEQEMRRWCRRVQQDAVEAIGIPGGRFMWLGSSTVINEAPAKALPTGELKMTMVAWPTEVVPVELIRGIQGKVNATIFDTHVSTSRWPFSRHQPGTLLATGVEYKHYVSHFGRLLTDFTLSFAVRNNGFLGPTSGWAGWNHLYRYSTGAWTLVTHDGTANGRRIYETADYSDAVTPGSPFSSAFA
jgi:hypothetical protein